MWNFEELKMNTNHLQPADNAVSTGTLKLFRKIVFDFGFGEEGGFCNLLLLPLVGALSFLKNIWLDIKYTRLNDVFQV